MVFTYIIFGKKSIIIICLCLIPHVCDVFYRFQLWEDASPLQFVKTTSNSANIEISFPRLVHGDGRFPFDGPSGVLAHAFSPPFGDIHFDEDETFTHQSAQGLCFMPNWILFGKCIMS